MKIGSILVALLSLHSASAWAGLSILTTTTDLGYLAKQVGGDLVQVDTICRGTQDPHFIEAKPSYMLKASRADLILAVGLDLEVGYLPPILQGARNPKIKKGAAGYMEVGPLLQPIEATSSQVSRSEGDVHPYGNPHITLDPIRDGQAAVLIGNKFAELDPAHGDRYRMNAETFRKRIEEKTRLWQARIEKTGIKRVVTHHKTLNYFFDRFHLTDMIELEPKPGIPPTSGHTMEVIRKIQEQKIPLILVENFFDPTVTVKIKDAVPAVRVEVVPVAVDGAPGASSIEELMEQLVSAIEKK